MDRVNHGVYYKKNIRRTPPDTSASLCNILNKNLNDRRMVIKDSNEPNNSGNMDVDVEIDPDTAENLSHYSQAMEIGNMDDSDSDQGFHDAVDDIDYYKKYSSGVPAHRVAAVLDLANKCEMLKARASQSCNNASIEDFGKRRTGVKRPHSVGENDDHSRCKTARM